MPPYVFRGDIPFLRCCEPFECFAEHRDVINVAVRVDVEKLRDRPSAADHQLQDVADQFTPLVTFGAHNRDRAAQWNAVANLMRSGYLGDSQLEELDAILGLPIRDSQADAASRVVHTWRKQNGPE